jgi:hypothetical protein
MTPGQAQKLYRDINDRVFIAGRLSWFPPGFMHEVCNKVLHLVMQARELKPTAKGPFRQLDVARWTEDLVIAAGVELDEWQAETLAAIKSRACMAIQELAAR